MTVFIAMRRPYLRGIPVLRQQKGELARYAYFCEVHLRLEDGRPLVVEDFQKRMLAASREQAGILFAQAGGFVRRSEWLQARVKPTMRELRSRDSGRNRVMAADADTADGTISTLAVVDEVARHRSAELYGTLRDGLGPRQGRLIGISTAGDDEDSPLGRMRRSAYKLPTVERRDSVARSAPWAARCSAQTLTARS